MFDWHITQNQEYLNLCKKRLKEDKLLWVEQFSDILKKNSSGQPILINDIGCNVGHFCRAIKEYFPTYDYIGFDISETYLDIAKESFGDYFKQIDISKERPRTANVTIISSTLEHVQDHKQAVKNIISSTKDLIILRTFIGDKYLEEKCFKEEAETPYIIKQFVTKELEEMFNENNWRIEYTQDLATNGKIKSVCKNIFRTQKIIIAKKI